MKFYFIQILIVFFKFTEPIAFYQQTTEGSIKENLQTPHSEKIQRKTSK